MNSAQRFSVPELSVAHQALEDEVVIVHLTRGHYYSLSTSGAEAWIAIADGRSIGEVVALLAARYDDEAAISGEVATFVSGLLAEGLIVAANDVGAPAVAPEVAAEKVALTPLTWTKYTDLEQLMLVDPIHEVDEAGWPPAA